MDYNKKKASPPRWRGGVRQSLTGTWNQANRSYNPEGESLSPSLARGCQAKPDGGVDPSTTLNLPEGENFSPSLARGCQAKPDGGVDPSTTINLPVGENFSPSLARGCQAEPDGGVDPSQQILQPVGGESLPPQFLSSASAALGPYFPRYLASFSSPVPVSIRLNPNKLIHDYDDCEPVPWCPLGRYLPSRPNFTLDPLLHAGTYYVQEASSMFVDYIVRQLIQEPVTMLDLCAAPGGKTTAVRGALPEGSILFANEPVRTRAQILRENVLKFGHPDVIVTNNYPEDYALSGLTFDVILADVPCSGEGMFRKDPATISEWTPDAPKRCAELQRQIISEIWPTLRPGGILIYSTCTINTLENEDNIRYFIDTLGAEPCPIPIPPYAEMLSDETTSEFISGESSAAQQSSESAAAQQSSFRSFPIQTGDSTFRFIPGVTKGEGLFVAVLRRGHGLSPSLARGCQAKPDGGVVPSTTILQPSGGGVDPSTALGTASPPISPSLARGCQAKPDGGVDPSTKILQPSGGGVDPSTALGVASPPISPSLARGCQAKPDGGVEPSAKILQPFGGGESLPPILNILSYGANPLSSGSNSKQTKKKDKYQSSVKKSGKVSGKYRDAGDREYSDKRHSPGKNQSSVKPSAPDISEALTIGEGSGYPHVDVDLPTAIQYLRREALRIPDAPLGYIIITYRGFPLGFAKNIGSRANNLYPDPWRIRKQV